MIDIHKLENILAKVDKPARYIGGELNSKAVTDGAEQKSVRFLFAFPDVYEVGMSHLGTAILYHVVNSHKGALAERTFAPFPDMRQQMIQEGIPLYSLETFTPAAEFDVIGFNLSYEMCYTTVLSMLEIAGIPIHAEERANESDFPLVIAGGACTYNPEPLVDFMDLFVIGEGEEVTLELVELVEKYKHGLFTKQGFLDEASKIEGVYVPTRYSVEYNDDGTIKAFEGEPQPIYKRYVKDLDKSFYPSTQVVGAIAPVHDRATIELFRGCTRGCRFCQAGFIYRPLRERSRETLINQAKQLIQSTGYEEVSLMSLSSGDYSEIEKLSVDLLDTFESSCVSVSLPSLRIDSFDKEYAKRMQEARKTGYTFAPEAGTQRLRDVINKNVTEEDLLRSVRYAFESGATTIKLYFMMGLPTETFEDLEGIVDLAQKVCGVFRQVPKELRKGSLRLTVSVAVFVPKPFTPFQWEKQDSLELTREKQDFLRERLKKIRGVRFNWHDGRLSFLEAVFARGDRRLGKVLQYARENGAIFDSWQEHFDFAYFEEAFKKAGVDPHFYANRERSYDEVLPWDHISCRVSKSYMISEAKKAIECESTPDCRKGCTGCGFEGGCVE